MKSYVTEEKEIKKFDETSKEIYDGFSKAEKLVALNSPLMQFTVDIVILLISWIGGRLIIGTSLTTGGINKLNLLCNANFNVSYDVVYGTCYDYDIKSFSRKNSRSIDRRK